MPNRLWAKALLWMALVGGGLPNAEIARRLNVVEGTVKVFVISQFPRDRHLSTDGEGGNPSLYFGLADGASEGNIPKQVDGFNLEGLEFAPGSSTTVYLGFRAPLVPPSTGGKALVIPVTNTDRLVTGSHATFGTPILMDLGGLSVRDIRKNSANQYLIIAGSWAADDNSDPYALYSWDGVPAHAPVLVRSLPTADAGAWESIVDVPDLFASGARVQLVTDAGAADRYNDGTETKELPHNEWKKSRVTWFTTGRPTERAGIAASPLSQR
jgi:hypothetical protein